MRHLLYTLSILTVAATAAAQVPGAQQVRDSVDALAVAGPWLGMLLIAAGYYDLRRREGDCTKAAKEAATKHDSAIKDLTARVEDLHAKMYTASEHDASTLLAHAKEVVAIVAENTDELKRNTLVLERVVERFK